MGYITEEYYNEVYKGTPVDESELPRLIERASEVIDGMVVYGIDMDKLPEFACELVRRAVAAEVEYLDENGGVSVLSGCTFSQATLGKFSYSRGTSGAFSVSGVPVAPMSVSLLEKAGLLKRGLAP